MREHTTKKKKRSTINVLTTGLKKRKRSDITQPMELETSFAPSKRPLPQEYRIAPTT